VVEVARNAQLRVPGRLAQGVAPGGRVVTPQTSAVLLRGRDGCRTYLHENRVEPVLSPTTVPGEAIGGEVLRGYLLKAPRRGSRRVLTRRKLAGPAISGHNAEG